MSAFLFPLYVLVHLCVFSWCVYLWRVHRAPGAAWVTFVAGALIYDNLIVSLGTTIGANTLLEILSYPRFALHAFGTPFLMIAVMQIGAAGGLRWAASQQWKIAVWVLAIAMIIVGLFESVVGLEIVPACFDGIIRYTANLYPSHFCFEGQEVVRGGGPPIPAIVSNILTLVIGFALWRQTGWVWLMVGALLMFVAAGAPMSVLGMAPSNAGESVLMISYALTLGRFGRFRKQPLPAAA